MAAHFLTGLLRRLIGGQEARPRRAVLRTVESSGFPRAVVGEANYQNALSYIVGGRTAEGHDFRCQADLIPEPDNPHDAQAVRVEIDGRLVGYLAREDAAKFNAGMAKAGRAGAEVRCSAKIVGGWHRSKRDDGDFGVYLALKWPLKLETNT